MNSGVNPLHPPLRNVPFNPEIVGALAGTIAAVSLIPQVVHTCRTRSAGDLPFSWQIIHLTGLIIDTVYMVLLGGTAGWVTLLFEILFALMLLLMKIRWEFYTKRTSATDCKVGQDSDQDTTEFNCSSSECSSEPIDLEQQIETGIIDACLPLECPRVCSTDTMVEVKESMFRETIDMQLDRNPGVDFGEQLLREVERLSIFQGLSVRHPHIDVFDTDESPFYGIALSVWTGDCQLSVQCNLDCQILSIHFIAARTVQHERYRELSLGLCEFLESCRTTMLV
jgi:uncharacterized protein with PQ loop repeat